MTTAIKLRYHEEECKRLEVGSVELTKKSLQPPKDAPMAETQSEAPQLLPAWLFSDPTASFLHSFCATIARTFFPFFTEVYNDKFNQFRGGFFSVFGRNKFPW
jgi:hypothetical protein